jgi:hypothetical protein
MNLFSDPHRPDFFILCMNEYKPSLILSPSSKPKNFTSHWHPNLFLKCLAFHVVSPCINGFVIGVLHLISNLCKPKPKLKDKAKPKSKPKPKPILRLNPNTSLRSRPSKSKLKPKSKPKPKPILSLNPSISLRPSTSPSPSLSLSPSLS